MPCQCYVLPGPLLELSLKPQPGGDLELTVNKMIYRRPAFNASFMLTFRSVWSVGEQSLWEMLHHPSSVRDICAYGIWAIAQGLCFEGMEPERSRNR